MAMSMSNSMSNSYESIEVKGEVQSHGFSWEKEILVIYGATTEEIKSIKYNSKFDLPSQFNKINGTDLSIKTTGNKNSVCMADCLRVYDEVEKGFHLVVVHYKQNASIKQVVSIIEIDLSECRNLLFGSITREQIQKLDEAVKAVPQKRKPTPEEYKNMYSIRNDLQQQSGAIRFDIKCNSTQSRLQCSFNKFQSFIENNPTKIVTKNISNQIHGGFISKQIQSLPRKFKQKIPL